MKILLAATSDDVQTGASHCYLDIVREFKKRKLDFVSLVPKEGDLSRALENMNVKTYVVEDQLGAWQVNIDYQMTFINYLKYIVKCFLNYFSLYKVKRIIRDEKIDLVHINSLSRCTAAKAAYDLKIPYVWHFRELLEDGLKSKFVNEDKAVKLLDNAKKVVCISKTVENYYVSRYGLKNTCVIYDGVNIDKFYCKREILSSDKVRIGIIGRVDEQKRQNVFIDAISMLHKQYPNIECYIVGGYYDDEYYGDDLKNFKKSKLNLLDGLKISFASLMVVNSKSHAIIYDGVIEFSGYMYVNGGNGSNIQFDINQVKSVWIDWANKQLNLHGKDTILQISFYEMNENEFEQLIVDLEN